MPERPSKLKIYSLIALMTTMWSSNYIVAKYALREFPPLLASGLRMVVAGFIMIFVYGWHHSNRNIPPWTRHDVRLLAFLGTIGVGLNQLFFVTGISMTTVSHAAIMIGLTPVTVLVLAALMGLENLSIVRLLGMVTAIGGVAVLRLSASKSDGATLAGDLLVFLGVIHVRCLHRKRQEGNEAARRSCCQYIRLCRYGGRNASDNSRVLTRLRLFTCNMDCLDERGVHGRVSFSGLLLDLLLRADSRAGIACLGVLLSPAVTCNCDGDSASWESILLNRWLPAGRSSCSECFSRSAADGCVHPAVTRESQLPVHLVRTGCQRVRRPLQ